MKKSDKQKSTAGFITYESENERLIKDVYRSDMDKLKLFTKMLQTNALLKKARIIHK
jgi:hypothetical protein